MQLKAYVPSHLLESKIFNINYEVQQREIDSYNESIKDLVDQCFVDTATWGLKFWEEFLGITVDENKVVDYRRSTIKAKLRGTGTITVRLIKNVAESFSNGEVEITENIQPFTFEVKFIGSRGIPPNLDDLKNAINEIKPAHLSVQYKFTYTVWKEVKNLTWGQVKTSTWNNLKVRKVI
ncbi:YmfQ family protein [Clostridium thailandense]|uniref:YmfQ family protein n=1 Tax=Clostridium thailandense TaxID=2794346 RepID=UPI003989C4A8